MKEPIVIPLIKENLLAFVKNSVGSNTFRNFYAEVNGEKKDITQDGFRSCAVFISSILLQFGLIKEGHTTVEGVIRDIEKNGWHKIDKPKAGCVLIWEPEKFDESIQLWIQHAGFYIGDDQAISNSEKIRTPQIHHWTYNDTKKITAMYWHDRLND